MKALISKLPAILLLTALCLTMSGCNNSGEPVADTQNMQHLLVAVYDDTGDFEVRELAVNLNNFGIELSKESLYTVSSGDNFTPRGAFEPIIAFSNMILLSEPPLSGNPENYLVLESSNELWYEDLLLRYYPYDLKSEISLNGKFLGTIKNMVYNDEALEPISFFANGSEISVLCLTREERGKKVKTVSFNAALKGDEYEITGFSDFTGMYSEELSELRMPGYFVFQTNVFPDAESRSFYWNEGCSIVRLDSVNGIHEVLLTKKQVLGDFSEFSGKTEGYTFFYMTAYRNGIYTVVFPNTVDTGSMYVASGLVAAFYNLDKVPLGYVLCNNGEEKISIYDGNSKLKAEIDSNMFASGLYVRQ